MKTLHALVLLISVSALSASDDRCVCNKAAEPLPVFDEDRTNIGDLKPNECNTYRIQSNVAQGWLTIDFNGEVGYIKQQDGISVNICMTQYEGNVEGTVFPATDFPPTDEPVMPPVHIVNNTVITNITYITNITNIINTNTTTNNVNTSHVHGHVHGHVHTTLSQALRGNTRLCPPYVVQGAHKNGNVLTQHGHSCYEICTDLRTWTIAKQRCKERGGHLVTIHSDKENTYLQHLLNHTYHHRVWIGLNDKANEEHFNWVTGEKVTYMHWKPHHRMSPDHNHENCVVMFSNGFWDDVACGINVVHATPHNYGYICEYGVHNGAHIIG